MSGLPFLVWQPFVIILQHCLQFEVFVQNKSCQWISPSTKTLKQPLLHFKVQYQGHCSQNRASLHSKVEFPYVRKFGCKVRVGGFVPFCVLPILKYTNSAYIFAMNDSVYEGSCT